jgi:hypothetical protein
MLAPSVMTLCSTPPSAKHCKILVYLLQPDQVLHGPFNFLTLNNRKTRDPILTMDWNLLIATQEKHNHPPPQFCHPTAHVVTTEQPITHHSEPSVAKQIEAFMFNIHFEDDTLQIYALQTNP